MRKQASERAKGLVDDSNHPTIPAAPASRRRFVVRKARAEGNANPQAQAHAPFPLVQRKAVRPPVDAANPAAEVHVAKLSTPWIPRVSGFDVDSEDFFAAGEGPRDLYGDDDEEDEEPVDELARRRASPAVRARRKRLLRAAGAVIAFAAGVAIFAGARSGVQALAARPGGAQPIVGQAGVLPAVFCGR